jgi:hypothetical protein
LLICADFIVIYSEQTFAMRALSAVVFASALRRFGQEDSKKLLKEQALSGHCPA